MITKKAWEKKIEKKQPLTTPFNENAVVLAEQRRRRKNGEMAKMQSNDVHCIHMEVETKFRNAIKLSDLHMFT